MERFFIDAEKIEDKKVIMQKGYRVSVITDRLFRIEQKNFTDSPSQAVICRSFGNPQFEVVKSNKNVTVIKTRSVLFRYDAVLQAIEVTDLKTKKKLSDGGNLGGTIRTLDFRLGKVKLGKGIMAKGGVSIYDDSKSFLLNSDGTLSEREKGGGDYYVFAYGIDYSACLEDFFALTGYPPLLPKYALTNWWSRYYPYSEKTYIDLMNKFVEREIPIGVATVDMDWHWVKEIPKEYKASNLLQGAGWTGYSWNRNLFPDYKRFLNTLHSMGMAVTLNIHPRDGVRAFEDMYPEMAKANGIDPSTKKTVEFDMTDPKFITSYFDVLHHPYEKDGVNFWWIDWQQGKKSKVKGLDPLWLLNHYHFLDSVKNGDGLILSRYAGIGSHRYPLGFSGDCIIAWKSLKFQPYFTVNATNVGYTWWSHDIGGHVLGKGRDELYLRWLQFGVFSPINRLHSSSGEFTGKEPWLYRRDVDEIAEDFLRLRHRLLPYLYTANKLTHEKGEPLMTPLYYKHSEKQAYKIKNEYYFGSELLVCPITSKIRKHFNRAGEKVYLPEGEWFDFFTNDRYVGGRTIKVWRKLDDIPVFAKAGAIVPMLSNGKTNKLDFDDLTVKLWAGNGEYTLYDEKGEITYKQTLNGDKLTVEISGKIDALKRQTICVQNLIDAKIKVDGKETDLKVDSLVLDGMPHTVEFSDMKFKESADLLEEVKAVMQDYHIFFPLRWLAFYKIKRAKDKDAMIKAIKKAPIRSDVKSAMLEKAIKE